ncbi:MAG: AAA family ATPase [Sedimenticola sp.]
MDIQFVTDPWACARYILEYISKGERQMGKLLKEASKEVVNDDSLRQQMKKVGNVFLSHREVSAQECVYRLLSMPLKRSSRQCVFVNTGMPDTRVRILKPKQVLEKLPDESEDVYQTSMLDRYSARPANLEDTCLADFATLYRTQSGNSDKEESVDEVQNIQNDAGKKITLQRGHGYMKQRKLRCIVRTPRFSRSKQSEAYYHSLLMLYLPWRNELPDLLHGDNLFEEHYQKMKDTVLTNQSLFEHNSEELDDALQNFDCSDQPESAWDKLASEAQHQHNDELDEGRLPSIDHEMLDPTELANRTIAELHASNNANVYVVESQTDRLPNPEYYALLRTLNCEQRSMFDNLLKWCRSSVSSTSIRPQKPDPFHIFVTGGAGTGKSHLIHALVNMMRRELQPICENPEGVTVLLSAPTGTAANNIDGTTIHQAFSIPVRKRGTKDSDYIPMGHDKLATVRFHLQSLKVLIVDEISMVGSNILWYIHRRLQDIMGTPSDDVFFGGVSVIAVGDFYQIPPVLQKPIFATPSDEYARLNPIHMWKDLFKMYELTQIMRQGKDTEFAQLLNRVRVAHVTDSDIQLLKGREVSACQEDYPTNALHVFTDNHKVDQHNQKMLQTIDGPVRHFNAKDWKKDMGTEQAGVSTSSKASETGGLRECLSVGVGARVMLTKNVDVSDGLVNGAIGTVTGFIEPERKCETNFPTAILVQFDSIKAGRKLRMKLKKSPKDPVPIQLDEARFTLGRSSGECVRRQFPLTLCFAATIHKVQGLSLDEIVVCFDGRFNTGQAYVALSRCRTLDGLYLQQFDKKKITVSKPVETEMARLRLNTLDPQSAHLLSTLPHDYFKICHLNIRSLAAHFTDLQSSHPLLTCDIICLSETWLNKSKQTKDYTLDGYSLFRTDREDMHPRCHKHDCKMCNDKGGVAMFIRSDVMCHRQIDVEVKDLECIVVSCKTEPDNVTYIVTLYRPDHIPLNVLNNAVENILSKIPADADVVFTGDFNIDVYKNKSPSALTPLSDGGFVQLISTPTHRLGSLLDHIYVPKIKSGIPSGVIPQYYTDHNAVFCAFPPHVDANNNTSYVLDLNLAKTPQNKHTAHYSKQHVTSNVVSPLTSKSTMKVPQPIFHRKYKETNKKAAPTLAATSLVQAVGSHDNSNDVTCTGSEEGNLNPGTFNPPNEQDRLKLSDTYHLPLKNDTNLNPSKRDHSYRSILKELPTQNPRSQIDVMRDDGNCFFRVISKELFGTEDYHAHIRNIICNFMASHPFTFSNWYYLGEVQFYNHVQEMRRSRVWAEEVELLAVASYFHTSIWEYTNSYPVGGPWHWVKIEPLASHPADPPFDGFALHGSFYIHHTNGNHFDRIIAPPSS